MGDGSSRRSVLREAASGDLGIEAQTAVARANEEDPSGRLARYLARTQVPLDVLALVTLWIVVVPIADFGATHDLRGFGLGVRILLSVIYGIDITIRAALAQHHWRYLRSHPLGVFAVVLPPARVLFSLRLIRVLFRRGNLARFLIAALVLLINGALIVFLFERNAPDANITTLGGSFWWAVVTVTTVGYGDYFPVTVQGRVVASFIMLIGIITVAVITAQVASTFVDQSAKRNVDDAVAGLDGAPPAGDSAGAARDADPTAVPDPPVPVTLAELDARLARIEDLLSSLQAPPDGGTGDRP